MTDPSVLEISEGLGIKKCPKCGGTEFIVHKDNCYRVDVQKEAVTETPACEQPFEDITSVRCAKCGVQVGTEQDFVIFKTTLKEALQDALEREPTEEEFLAFWDFLDTDIPQWIKDNIDSWEYYRNFDAQQASEKNSD